MSEGPMSEIPQSPVTPEVQKTSIAQASREWLQARADSFNRAGERMVNRAPKLLTDKANEYTMYALGALGGGMSIAQGNPEAALALSAVYGGVGLGMRAVRERLYPEPRPTLLSWISKGKNPNEYYKKYVPRVTPKK